MPGPKPLPKNIRMLKGERRPSQVNHDEPKVKITLPDPPDEVRGRALEIWNDLGKKLVDLGVLAETDAKAFASLCIIEAQILDTYAELWEYKDVNGTLYTTSPKGYVMQHPLLNTALKLQEKAMKLRAEFGLTPSSRTKIVVDQKSKDSKDKKAGVTSYL